MDKLLAHLGVEQEKSYRYYLAIKSHENSAEKTLLVSGRVWSHLDVRKIKKSVKYIGIPCNKIEIMAEVLFENI